MNYDYRYLQSIHPYNPVQLENEVRLIDSFYKKKKFEPDMLMREQLNPDIKQHPGILRALQTNL